MLLIVMPGVWLMMMALLSVTCWASAAGSSDDQLTDSEEYEDELLDDMDTRQMQEIMDELLEDSSFSFLDAMKELLKERRPSALSGLVRYSRRVCFRSSSRAAVCWDRSCFWHLREPC